MRNPGGYVRITSPEGVRELDSYTCGHCGRVTFVRPKERPEDLGGLCRLCGKPVCSGCHRRGTCDPLEKKLDRVERTQDFRRWFAEAL